MTRFQSFIIKRKLSLWLYVVVLILTAIMIQPSFAAIFIEPIIAFLIFILRAIAQLEGRIQEQTNPESKIETTLL